MPTEPTVLLAAQCRAARALIEWAPERLAQTAAVDLQTIREFEARFRRPDVAARQRIRIALEEAGVAFIDENGGGAGARLKFSRKEVRAIGRWESEGGAVGEDDI